MRLQTAFGLGLIVLAAYFFFGSPNVDRWPDLLGRYVREAVNFGAAWHPYSGIILFVLGIAFLVMTKPYE